MGKKVIVKLAGGIGNQFFQYSAAFALAKKIGAELKLDVSLFNDYKLRNYELANFCIEQVFASEDEIAQLKKKKLFSPTYFKEKKGKFISLKPKGSVYLEGYFQSEKYFCDYKFEINSAFEFRNFDFIKNEEILNKIRSENSVSIHVRGGDYINDPETAKIYNVCGRNYYKNAIEYARCVLENPTFYVFTDDPEHAKTLVDEGIFIDTENWSENLYFMQSCRHNIIPNSSFSWMAAWLNKNPEKLVLAPKKWFRNGSGIDYKNIACKDWVKIEA